MLDSMAMAIGITGSLFAISFGVIGVVKAQTGDRKCPDHQSMSKGVDEFKSLTRAILVAFSDIASIKQAMIWIVVDKTDDTPEGRALTDKVVQLMMNKPTRGGKEQ
jgi:hypothetical protein